MNLLGFLRWGGGKCTVRDLEVMGSNPGWVKIGVRITSVLLEENRIQ